jgi:hypothetical protein
MSLTQGVPAGAGIPEHNEEDLVKQIEFNVKGESSPSPSNAESSAEKGDVRVMDQDVSDGNDDLRMLSHEEQFPIDPDAPEERQQFTVRATLVGCMLGGVIAASK